MIDWADEVKQYKEQERNGFTQEVSEWVDSLLPQYYNQIMDEFNNYCSISYEIESHHVGLPIWQVMVSHIYDEYLEAFYTELNRYDEEE